MLPCISVFGVDFWQLVTVCIAAFVAWTTWQSHSLSKEKFKLDLFEKRFAVFSSIKTFLLAFVRDAKVDQEQFRIFIIGTSEAIFLFDQDIVNYIDGIKEKANAHMSLEKQLENAPMGERRNQLVEKQMDHLIWLMDQLEDLNKTFLKYLGFAK